MKKQEYLTGFPTTILATAKRKMQASMRRSREEAIRSGSSGYASLFADVLPFEFLSAVDPTERQRHYGHIPVLWAWIGQIIEGNASCKRAVSLLISWCTSAKIQPPKADSSSYCQARMRMDDDFLEVISDRVNTEIARISGEGGTWRGLRLKAFDGSSIGLSDTEANQVEFPQPSFQKEGCGFPVMGFCAAFDLSNGSMLGHVTADQNTHDSAMAGGLVQYLNEGDLLLGDRAFCSYELFALAQARGAHSLMRLHQARHAKLDWRKGKKIGKNERLIIWKKPVTQSRGSRLSKSDWNALPDQLTVRYVRLGFEDREGLERSLVIATTLTDPISYPMDEVADLYCVRWQIEVRFRDIKTTMNMEIIDVKTPEMAKRTMVMMSIAYNLLRLLMIRSADHLEKPRDRISYKGAMDAASSLQSCFSGLVQRPRLRQNLLRTIYVMMTDKLVPLRLLRREPRVVKRRPKTYQLLTDLRSIFQEQPHRSKYRSLC